MTNVASIHAPLRVLQSTSLFYRVTVTAYTNHSKCGKGNPNLTASEIRIKDSHYGKLIALSSDLAGKYDFGDQFQLWINKKSYRVTFLDKMPKRYHKKVDLLLPSLKACTRFGKRRGVLIPLDES